MAGRPRSRLTYLRLVLGLALLVSLAPVVGGVIEAPSAAGDSGDGDPPSGALVVTIDATGPGQLVAYGPDGEQLYRNDSYDLYHDVDPSPVGNWTVLVVASERDYPASYCETDRRCILNVVDRVNLTTGNVTRVYDRFSPQYGSSQTHDVDRVNESVLLVGDIGPPDRVYMVDIRTDEVIWEWRVEDAYDPGSGGQYPDDWTHLNDVAPLDDGRVMVNLRNHDQVVFIEPGQGIQENWTLGTDDDHDILFEPHNPDYIPPERGGPAILIADSENNRVVEYQRVDGEWVESWRWTDARLQWPRDADRLPNGNTLVVDSHGSRLLEVSPAGDIVWQRAFPNGGYDAELLGTGDESATGRSAVALGANRTSSGGRTGVADELLATLTGLVPALVLHGLLFALPNWVTPIGAVGLIAGAGIIVAWAGVELWQWHG